MDLDIFSFFDDEEESEVADIPPSREELANLVEQHNKNSVEVVPEYERSLERVILTFPRIGSIEETYGDFILNCPEYTHFEVVISSKYKVRDLRVLFRQLGVSPERYSFYEQEKGSHIELWAQDYTDVVTVNGKRKLLMGMNFEDIPFEVTGKNYQFLRRINARNELLKELLNEEELFQVPFFFEGGNMFFDTNGERLRVFVGYDSISKTQQAYAWRDVNFSEEEIEKMMSAYFGGAEIIVMGYRPQPTEVFHLDLLFTILDDQTVVMRVPNQEETAFKAEVNYAKFLLSSMGYKIIEIPTTVERFEEYMSCVNGIPFVDKETGVKKMMFPVYQEDFCDPLIYENPLEYFRNYPITEDDLTNEGLAAYRAFREAGYEPIPVRNFTFDQKGSLHCITNVLAAIAEKDDGVEVV
ncbi:hypothetical protein HN748_00485 [Candidatus Peregrinibacteria bacterium]|nr:hypothetical protein [Candidatus Peregrinibacteria bacterium]MBT7484268.1 hypothetical protein [Candidatus Peregrinibacteria bacterium]MBT7702690.1 hypothetical protein [Candidatus Peregrinibacteria bacterium]